MGGDDAFLLESIFRSEVWDFMNEPVSRTNEEAVNDLLATRCVRVRTCMRACLRACSGLILRLSAAPLRRSFLRVSIWDELLRQPVRDAAGNNADRS